MMAQAPFHIIDSHTEGEPTWVLVSSGPDLGNGPLSQRAGMLQENHDWLRSAICNEPRGHQAMVGALLCQPHEPDCVCGVIFFNIVSTLNAGKLKPGQVWRQAGILDTVFSGTIEELPDGRIIPRVCGRAWVIGEYTYIFNPGDPFRHGIPSTI